MTRDELEQRSSEVSEVVNRFMEDTGAFGFSYNAVTGKIDVQMLSDQLDTIPQKQTYKNGEIKKQFGDVVFFALHHDKTPSMKDIANTLLTGVRFG